MSTIPPSLRSEQTRRAIMEFLSPRQTLKFDAASIQNRIIKLNVLDFTPDADDIAQALTFLRGLHFVDYMHGAVGSTPFYQATSAGVLATERGELG